MVRRAARDLWLDVPGNGVLMTVPVSSIGGTSVKEYLTQNQEGEEPMEREIAHELILVIANQGHTDQVMGPPRHGLQARAKDRPTGSKSFSASLSPLSGSWSSILTAPRTMKAHLMTQAIMARDARQIGCAGSSPAVPVKPIAGPPSTSAARPSSI